MKELEIEELIEIAAWEINQRKARDERLDGWVLPEGRAEPLRNEVRDRLKDALKKAEALEKALHPLMMMADEIPFHGMSLLIKDAYSDANYAVTRCSIALNERLPAQRRGMPYHQDAVELAASLFSSPTRKETLEVAARIIEAAGLSDDYTTEAAHRWWADYRKAEQQGK
jgi:hypothetical protein